MLQIKDIRKQYITGDLVQTALDGVSLTLRDNEFVAILGPSGSGKTTLLNVIGGLDRYDSGDLIINGISTKEYTDRDWDSYRNHTVGFIFQSYNLIPHQSVLANVELALTISGISRSERRRRAKEALEAVGLGDQLHKKPNQMSGGQMQRVAIARALVNDPDILLADEPTGALDTQTSVQVMDLLKEVAKDKLVVMVTHNPELAEQYANRIVRVKDGQIIGDTNPYTVDTLGMEPPHHENMGKASMSLLTAMSLSFNNLWTKKGRTLLTAFAGSIGIIGIALIMSLSTGFQKYIDKIQEDTLSNYPLSIQSETADMTAALAAMGTAAMEAEENDQEGVVQEQQMISQMFGQIGSNDLGAFKTHMDENMDQVSHTLNYVKYGYGIKPQIFMADTSEKIIQANPATVFRELTGNASMSAYMDSDIFYEMMDNIPLLEAQYQVLRGKWPENYNEMVLVLSDPNRLPDYTAYTLGLRDSAELDGMIDQVMAGEEREELDLIPMEWTYDELMALEFKLVPAAQRYRYNSEYAVWEDMSDDESYMRERIENAEDLKIVGIVAPKEGITTTALSSGIAYLPSLTQYVIDTAADTEIVAQQLADTKTDVFTGIAFGEESEDGGLDFENMITIDESALSNAFGMNIDTGAISSAFNANISQDAIIALMENYLKNALSSIDVDTGPAQAAFLNGLKTMSTGMLNQYIAGNAGADGKATIYLSNAQSMVESYLSGSEASGIIQNLENQYGVDAATFRQVYQPLMTGLINCYVASEFAESGATVSASESNLNASQLPEESTQQPTEPEVTEPPETTPTTEATQATEATEATQPTETTAPTQPTTPTITPTIPDVTVPEVTIPQIQPQQISASISADQVEGVVAQYMQHSVVVGVAGSMSLKMMESSILDSLNHELSGMGNVLMSAMGSSLTVDQQKIASAFQFRMDEQALANAFQFNMNEEDLQRLMTAMSTSGKELSAEANLRSLGYADVEKPTSMSIYFVDFEAKEEFLAFLDGYNDDMEAAGLEDQVISYTDITGIMMSSVRTIIDSVSYALIAFVAVSLIVSSIMIGIITYISVMERTKEIGVLRAIGASKRNISQVFNAETFIIGLSSGLLGIGVTLALLVPINALMLHLTNNPDIVAQLPVANGAVLVLLSVLLTLIGGFIPSKQAAKKDPVIALRSE